MIYEIAEFYVFSRVIEFKKIILVEEDNNGN